MHQAEWRRLKYNGSCSRSPNMVFWLTHFGTSQTIMRSKVSMLNGPEPFLPLASGTFCMIMWSRPGQPGRWQLIF
jgi:hypothetical protein